MERQESTYAFEGLGDGGAEDLLQETFGELISRLTGDPTQKLLDADEVLSFIDDNTAI